MAVVVPVVVALQVDAVEDYPKDGGVGEVELSFGLHDGFSVSGVGSGDQDDSVHQVR